MATLTSTNNQARFTPFIIAPFGTHEGDWEAVSVIVCRSTESMSEPLAVSYRQHGWSQMTDCTKGECNFYRETNHPVGFAALNSHATYPISTQYLVYTTVELPFYVNLQGVFVTDRTVYKYENGFYKYWFPSTENLVALRDPYSLTDPLDPDAWQAFAGGWGDRIDKEDAAVGKLALKLCSKRSARTQRLVLVGGISSSVRRLYIRLPYNHTLIHINDT